MNDIACTLNVPESTGYLLCVCVGEQKLYIWDLVVVDCSE